MPETVVVVPTAAGGAGTGAGGSGATSGSEDLDLSVLKWAGWMTKKAFKTITKQNWKRRWCVFEPSALKLSWHASEGSKALGEFVMDPLTVLGQPTLEHSRLNELKIECAPHVFYGCTESPEDRQKLLIAIDMARRVKIAGDNGETLIRHDDAKVDSVAAEPGRKVFSWGVGTLLANGDPKAQAWALPQRITALKPPVRPGSVIAGPEHASCVDVEGNVHLWGSNEFTQTGASGGIPIVYKPLAIGSFGVRKVLSVACGGSHTLAIVGSSVSDTGGVLLGWGTGTVGQLGLTQSQLLCDSPSVITLPETRGKSLPVTRVYAGIVTSAAINAAGDCFVWGDASLGRLGLPDIPDLTAASGVPILVNSKIIWTPTQIKFNPSELGAAGQGLTRPPTVAQVCLGGSFTLFLLYPGTGPGCVLLSTGALGVDITRDRYGYPEDHMPEPKVLDGILDEEIKGVPRRITPGHVTPFGSKPIVLAACAGARHAGVIVCDEAAGNAPRLYTAGKNWLAHGGSADTLLLPKPTMTTFFAPVAGALEGQAVVEVACGHSHTVARTADGRLFSWGRGDSGELGQGRMVDRSMPAEVRRVDGHLWSQVVAGSYYTAGIAEPGVAGSVMRPTGAILDDFSAKYGSIARAEAAQVDELEAAEAAARAAAEAAKAQAQAAVSQAAPWQNTQAYAGSHAVAGGDYGRGGDGGAGSAAPAPADAPAAAYDESSGAGTGSEAAAGGSDEPQPLPDGWDYDYDSEGTIYFIRPDGGTQWEDPREQG